MITDYHGHGKYHRRLSGEVKKNLFWFANSPRIFVYINDEQKKYSGE